MLIRPYQFQPDPDAAIQIKALIVLPQFVFVNQTNFDLLLAQPGVNHLQKVKIGERVPVVWRQAYNKMLSFSPMMDNLEVQ